MRHDHPLRVPARAWSYRVKVPVLIIGISLSTALAISLAIALSARHWLKEDLRDHATAVAQSLARGLVVHMARDDVWEAFEAVKAISNVEGGAQRCDVVVLDRTGRIFVASDPIRFGVRQNTSVLSPPLQRALALAVTPGAASVVEANVPDGSYSVLKMPLLSTDQELLGTLLMSYSHAIFAQRYLDTLKTLATITAGLVVVLLPLGWWLGHRLASPMTRVTDALYRMGAAASKHPHRSSRGDAASGRQAAEDEPLGEIARLEHSLETLQAQLNEKEELQRQFIAADRLAAIGRMTSGVAHEINNPLGGMLNALSNLRKDPTQIQRTLGFLERGLDQIRQTLSALLIETKTSVRPLSLSDIEDLRLLIASQAKRKRLQLTWSYPIATDLPLPAAPVRQIVLNLLLNAVQAAGRAVQLDAAVSNDRLVLTISNDGKSFPECRRQQPFVPSVGADGHGLGLWACHQLVTSLGGNIVLLGDAERTCFQVTLPLQQALKDSTVATEEAA